jgi:hypothetical protein
VTVCCTAGGKHSISSSWRHWKAGQICTRWAPPQQTQHSSSKGHVNPCKGAAFQSAQHACSRSALLYQYTAVACQSSNRRGSNAACPAPPDWHWAQAAAAAHNHFINQPTQTAKQLLPALLQGSGGKHQADGFPGSSPGWTTCHGNKAQAAEETSRWVQLLGCTAA